MPAYQAVPQYFFFPGFLGHLSVTIIFQIYFPFFLPAWGSSSSGCWSQQSTWHCTTRGSAGLEKPLPPAYLELILAVTSTWRGDYIINLNAACQRALDIWSPCPLVSNILFHCPSASVQFINLTRRLSSNYTALLKYLQVVVKHLERWTLGGYERQPEGWNFGMQCHANATWIQWDSGCSGAAPAI